MLTFRRRIAFAICSTVLGGCQPGQLYVASNTVVGVHAAVNTAQTSGSLQIGYDRQFANVIPRSVTVSGNQGDNGLPAGTTAREAMSVIGCSDLVVDGIFLSQFTENLASGRAALNYARALQSTDGASAQRAADFINCPASTTQ